MTLCSFSERLVKLTLCFDIVNIAFFMFIALFKIDHIAAKVIVRKLVPKTFRLWQF